MKDMEQILIKPGIHKGMDISVYHGERNYISSSSIKEAIKSLSHFHYYRTSDKPYKSHFDFGNAFELALLDYAHSTLNFMNEVVIFDADDRPEKDKGITSNINQEWKKSILNGEKYVINKSGDESFETLQLMLQSCAKDSVIQKLLRNTEYQNSYFWKDEETGLLLKTRPDLTKIGKNVIIDIKTALDGSPQAFSKQAASLEYPIQAVLQMRGLIATGQMNEVDAYYWLVAEKKAPYNAQIYEFPKEDWQFVNDKLSYHLTTLERGIREHKYVGYGQAADNEYGILRLELPLYYRNI